MYCNMYHATISIKHCIASQEYSLSLERKSQEKFINRDSCLYCKDKENLIQFNNCDIEKIKVEQKKKPIIKKIPINDSYQRVHRFFENIIMR